MISGYEARGHHADAWKLSQTVFESYRQNHTFRLDTSNSGLLPQILRIHQTSPEFREGRPLFDLLPRDEALQLLSNQNFPATFRALVSKSLRDPQIDPQIDVIRLQKKGHEDILVRADILCFWSPFFKAALSGRWGSRLAIDLNPEFSIDSIKRIFDGFFHSGVYSETDVEKRRQDLIVADFYQVTHLLEGLDVVMPTV